MLLSLPPRSSGAAEKLVVLPTWAPSAGETRLMVGFVLSTVIDSLLASFSLVHEDQARTV